jgi:hypothetical protein
MYLDRNEINFLLRLFIKKKMKAAGRQKYTIQMNYKTYGLRYLLQLLIKLILNNDGNDKIQKSRFSVLKSGSIFLQRIPVRCFYFSD